MSQISRELKLSIVILAYNEEDYIGACLDSIARQTIRPDEVIVVNNNSVDQTVAIAERYKFVKIINEPRQGMIAARNTGLKYSSGDIVGRIDADTVLPTEWVANIHKIYEKEDSQTTLLTGGTTFSNAPFKTFGYIAHYLIFFWLSKNLLGFRNLFGSNMVLTRPAINCLLRTTCRQEYYHEDIDISLHFKFNNFRVKVAHGLRVQTTLRGILNQPFANDNRVIMWQNTLLNHGIARLRVFMLLGGPILIIRLVGGFQRLSKRLQVILASGA